MDTKRIASHIVLYFHIGGGERLDKWFNLAVLLKMPLTKEDIRFGVNNVFYNNEKKWKDWQQEGGVGMQCYGLRMFVANALESLNKWPILSAYEDEVARVEGGVDNIIYQLRQRKIKIGDPSIVELIKKFFNL